MDATSRAITSKNRSHDIILVLKKKEGEKPLNGSGVVDNRLFTGENRLHAIMNTQTCLWHLAYDNGVLPQPFKQEFTSFSKLKTFVADYFSKRNIEIVEVID